MRHQPGTSEPFPDRTHDDAAAKPKSGSSALKLVLVGTLAPLVLYALVVGGTLIAKGTAEEGAALAGREQALDCDSPRDAWRSPCQKVATDPGAKPQSVAATAEDKPVATGTVERRTSGRSSTVKNAAAEIETPVSEAIQAKAEIKPAVEPPAQAGKAAAPTARKEAAAARADADRQEPASADQTGARSDRLARSAKPADETPKIPIEDLDDAEANPTAMQVGRPLKAVSDAKAEAPRVERKTADSSDPEVSRDERPAPAATASIRKKSRPQALAVTETAKPARPATPRVRPGAAREARAVVARRAAVAERRQAERRSRLARSRQLEDEDALPSGYRVMSVRTYEYDDGRTVTIRVPPRPEVVRDLLSRHEAFTGPRVVYVPRW